MRQAGCVLERARNRRLAGMYRWALMAAVGACLPSACPAQAPAPVNLGYPWHDYVQLDGKAVAYEYRYGGASPAVRVSPPRVGADKTSASTWDANGNGNNANFNNGYRTKLFALASDDVSPLAVEYLDSASGNLLASFVKLTEAINAGKVRASLWRLQDFSLPNSSLTLRVRFASACTAKTSSLVEVKGVTGSLEVQAVGTGSGTTASTGLTPASIAEQQLLISVLAIEGPSNDPLGLWSNSFINGCTVSVRPTPVEPRRQSC